MLSEDPKYGPTPVGPTPSVAMSVDRLSNCDLTAIGHPLEKTPSHLLPPQELAEQPMVECDAKKCTNEVEKLTEENDLLKLKYREFAQKVKDTYESKFRTAVAECTKQMSRAVQENMQLREKLDCYERVFTDQKQAIQETLAFFPDLMSCLRDDGFSFSRTLQINVNREQNFRLEEYQRISWQEAQQKLYGLVKSGEIGQDRLEKGICTDLAPASSSSVSSSKARMVSHEKSFDADSCITGSGSPSVSGIFSPDVAGENEEGEFDPAAIYDAPVLDQDIKRGAQVIDIDFMEDFHDYFFECVESPTFTETHFIKRLRAAMFKSDGPGTDVLDQIVSDFNFQWTSLRMTVPITFDVVMDFLSNVTLTPSDFDEEKLTLFKRDEGSRVGIIRETCPRTFSADLVGTCLDWRSAPRLFWTVSAEHYLNWNTPTSQAVRALVCGRPAKK